MSTIEHSAVPFLFSGPPVSVMTFEVELKFPVSDLSPIELRLESLGAVIEVPVHQSDIYYCHPSRDFAQTDEALRIRRVGSKNFVTYKGPKLDDDTKTRREIEVPLISGAEGAKNIVELIEALGFEQCAQVVKNRRKASLQFDNFQVEAALDEVVDLGTFVELEISADQTQLEAAKQAISHLASELGLTQSERRSYLELVIAQPTNL
ncbi:MAG: class IV adenylate cyclase [Pirellulaceae bacterium]